VQTAPCLRGVPGKILLFTRVANYAFVNFREKKRTQRALTKEEMKDGVWLEPELVAQIEFTEWTPDGHLRHSKFVGLREDKDPWKVVRE